MLSKSERTKLLPIGAMFVRDKAKTITMIGRIENDDEKSDLTNLFFIYMKIIIDKKINAHFN